MIVEEKIIRIEPADPQIIYVPAYNPVVVYGPWWYPAYPPYYWGPRVAAPGLAFAAGVAVGVAWSHGWGNWNWGNHTINVNVNKNININHNVLSTNVQTNKWSTIPITEKAWPIATTQPGNGMGKNTPGQRKPGRTIVATVRTRGQKTFTTLKATLQAERPNRPTNSGGAVRKTAIRKRLPGISEKARVPHLKGSDIAARSEENRNVAP